MNTFTKRSLATAAVTGLVVVGGASAATADDTRQQDRQESVLGGPIDIGGIDIGSQQVLKSYQASRRFSANAVALGFDAIDRLFSNDLPLTKPVRSLGLLLADKLPPFRRRLAGIASASSPALPSLMQPHDAA